MAWIKIDHVTPDKPEIVNMADILKIDQDAVLGKCVRIWIWADQQMIDESDLLVTTSFLDRLTNCPGFAVALVEIGWLKSRNGRISIPHFDRHNGQSAKNRALSADRMTRQRYAQTVTTSSPDKIREEQEEEKEKEKKKEKPKSTASPPVFFSHEFFSDPDFLPAWVAWQEMRKKLRKPATTRAQEVAFEKLLILTNGDARKAIRIVNNAIERCWLTFYPEKEESNATNQRPAQRYESAADKRERANAAFLRDLEEERDRKNDTQDLHLGASIPTGEGLGNAENGSRRSVQVVEGNTGWRPA